MNKLTLRARALRAAEICQEVGLTQSDVASAVGASQSQVSRILAGKGLRPTRLLDEVCLYVERHRSGVTAVAVRKNAELIDAVRSAWDGSAAHARALAIVIKSLAVLRVPAEAHPRQYVPHPTKVDRTK